MKSFGRSVFVFVTMVVAIYVGVVAMLPLPTSDSSPKPDKTTAAAHLASQAKLLEGSKKQEQPGQTLEGMRRPELH